MGSANILRQYIGFIHFVSLHFNLGIEKGGCLKIEIESASFVWLYTSATSSTPYTHTARATLQQIIDTNKRQKPKGKHAGATATKKDKPDKQEINTAAKKNETELK